MRRRLFIAAIFLLAGAVVNVAVAWGCWRGSEVSLPRSVLSQTMQVAEALKIAEDLGFAPQISIPFVHADGLTIRCGFGTTLDVILISQSETVERPYADVVSDLPRETASISYATVRRVQAGWPTHTMRGYEITVKDKPDEAVSVLWAFPVGEVKPPFPLLPMWPGFPVNTLLYAVVLWLLICGPFVPRRAIRVIRVKRGRCPACAYPMGQSDVCSECGKPLPERMAVTK